MATIVPVEIAMASMVAVGASKTQTIASRCVVVAWQKVLPVAVTRIRTWVLAATTRCPNH